MKAAIVLAGLLSAGVARADQCEWLEDPAVATRAMRELASRPEVIAFCEPCGDVAPGTPHTPASAMVTRVDDHAVALALDGQRVDLAYLYVKTSAEQYRNLAALAGCPTTGVSPSLRVDRSTTAGVLIRAESSVAPAPLDHAVAAPAAAAPTIVVVAPGPSLWLAALLGLGVPLLLVSGLALCFAVRRRPGHIPRASRLVPPR